MHVGYSIYYLAKYFDAFTQGKDGAFKQYFLFQKTSIPELDDMELHFKKEFTHVTGRQFKIQFCTFAKTESAYFVT